MFCGMGDSFFGKEIPLNRIWKAKRPDKMFSYRAFLNMWRKHMGIEPTRDGVNASHRI